MHETISAEEQASRWMDSKWIFSKHPTSSDPFWSCGCGKKGIDRESWILHNDICKLNTGC